MLLSSPLFVFLFLPTVIAGFFACGHWLGPRAALTWLCATSIVFYLNWNPVHGWVLVATLAFNYTVARQMADPMATFRRSWLVAGVIANAAFLACFKVLAGGIWDASGGFLASTHILIPLAISFITFQQIAFIVDTYKQRIKTVNFLDYLAFILFFPQLVMGPIVHYRDMSPQFHRPHWVQWDWQNASLGCCIFIIGLFKKLVIADSIAPYVNEGFANPQALNPLDAWAVVIGFQMQLYFDFSGYADMAIGIARLLNIQLPINFDAPYKATDRFDQWRRWHISFSAFMRHYIFFPLARNRWLPMNATQALFVVAVFSGFWHGLGITFLLWGLAQAVLMRVIHWRRKWQQRLPGRWRTLELPVALQVLLTFWMTLMLGALFRSPDIPTAAHTYMALYDPRPLMHATDPLIHASLWSGPLGLWLLLAAFVTWCLPTTQQFFSHYWTALDQRHEIPQQTWAGLIPPLSRLRFSPNAGWAMVLGLMFTACIAFMDRGNRFIYYQF